MPQRKLEAAVGLLQTLTPAQRASVKAVAMDMWPAYMSATRQCMPQADIVHDKFHISKYLGEAVDAVRKQEHRSLSQAGSSPLKGTHDATFSPHAPHAKSVEIIGNFNFWQTGTVALAGPDEKGMWQVKVPLPANLTRIEYVYWVDGTSRKIDPAQPVAQDEFSGENNVLVLP